MLAHVQGRFAGPLDVQNRRVLAGEIGRKTRRVGRVLLPRPCDAALDDRRLIDQETIFFARETPGIHAGEG